MMGSQILPAFIGQLVAAGVGPEVVERAVMSVRDTPLGSPVIPNDDPLIRAFAFEQADLLRRPR